MTPRSIAAATWIASSARSAGSARAPAAASKGCPAGATRRFEQVGSRSVSWSNGSRGSSHGGAANGSRNLREDELARHEVGIHEVPAKGSGLRLVAHELHERRGVEVEERHSPASRRRESRRARGSEPAGRRRARAAREVPDDADGSHALRRSVGRVPRPSQKGVPLGDWPIAVSYDQPLATSTRRRYLLRFCRSSATPTVVMYMKVACCTQASAGCPRPCGTAKAGFYPARAPKPETHRHSVLRAVRPAL